MSNAVISDWPSGSANQGWPQEPSAMLMPGRVEGWPAGTQRAANAAERLLTQAVAWWDVGQYRDGDRFLRNRGTGGELLDLRLGSSIAANSNDPLYLPSADDGYVYLSGVAGNSLSVTAPATATQYIAYPLDRSASTATGAVVGGATFTFSTTGSWRLIELLDASNVVVDTIDCDVITSGSATSFTSGIVNQTVTVNRSTSGRKSVAMPSRHKGGKPVMLLGSDDFLEVQDNWQHGLLNIDNAMTIMLVYRYWHAAANPQTLLSKAIPSFQGQSVGWSTYIEGASINAVNFQVLGTNGLSSNVGPATTTGTLTVSSRSVDFGRRTSERNVNGTTLRNTINNVTGARNEYAVRLGRTAPIPTATGYFGNYEFYAAIVDRRPWTTAEMQTAIDYFQGRIA